MAKKFNKADIGGGLNAAVEAEDRKQYDILFKDDALKESVESVWFSLLSHGDSLVAQRCDIQRFKMFSRNAGLDIAVAMGNFDIVCTASDTIDWVGFVRVLFHTGMDFAKTTNYQDGLRAILPKCVAHDAAIRVRNDIDPTGSSTSLFSIPELDRVLFIYDGVFDRIFNTYRNFDKHQSRELTFEQCKILDQYLELDEFKEFCKDFGYFPKIISHVEISKACQCAAWGAVLIDPQKQSGSRTSALEEKKKKKDGVASPAIETPAYDPRRPSVAPPVGLGPRKSEASMLGIVANPIVAASLPEDMQTEILMEKSHFMDAMLRISQMMWAKPEQRRRLPTVTSRIEELLRISEAPYEKILQKKMLQDCDFVEPGIPMLLNSAPGAALVPSYGLLGQAFELSISGMNFCEKRAVFTRFGSDTSEILVKCTTVTRKRVVVVVPDIIVARNINVDVFFDHKIYSIQISKFSDVRIECSNNKFDFSETDPEQRLHLTSPCPKFVIEDAVCAKLLKSFATLCSQDDKYNTKYMNREKWKKFKKEFGVSETPFNAGADGTTDDPYFLDVAEGHDASGDVSTDFRAFLRVLTRCLYEMVECNDALVYGRMRDLCAHEITLRPKKVEEQAVAEDDMTITRQLIEATEQRSVREYDVYNGPVLCGTVCDRPGLIRLPDSTTRRHPYLTYVHYDINSQEKILFQISMSESFDHVISRVRACGFDIGAPAESIATRKPYGRCWSIRRSKEKIGVLWDYPGNFAGTTWLPVAVEAWHDEFCITMYVPHTSVDFVVVFMMFSRAKDISHLRTALAGKQYTLTTQLYRA